MLALALVLCQGTLPAIKQDFHRTPGTRVILVVNEADDDVALSKDDGQGGNSLHRVVLVNTGMVLRGKGISQ